MNIQKILTDARKLGLPETDLTKITTLSEQYNKAKTQLNDKVSEKKYEPRDLLNTKADDRILGSKGDLLRDKSKTQRNIATTKDSIREAKKEKREAFLKTVSRKERKKTIKAAKKKIKDGEIQIVDYQHHIQDIDFTVERINLKAKEDMTSAQTELSTIATSIHSQLETVKVLNQIKSIMKNKPEILNDPNFTHVIAFYSANSDKKPSLDNPLDPVPTELKVLLANIKINQFYDKMNGIKGTILKGVTNYKQSYTSNIEQLKEAIIKHIRNNPDFLKQYDINTIVIINPYLAQEIFEYILKMQQQQLLANSNKPLALEGKAEPKQLGSTIAVEALPASVRDDER